MVESDKPIEVKREENDIEVADSSRRTFMQTTGSAALSLGLVGESAATYHSNRSGETAIPSDRDDFLWIHGGIYTDKRVYQNLLTYAKRHGLLVVLSAASTTEQTAKDIEEPLQRAKKSGIEAWLATGAFTEDLTAKQIATDATKRQTHLDRLQAIADVYQGIYPNGRMTCWHEAPLVSNWVESGSYFDRHENMVKYGPRIFTAQKSAIKAVSDKIDVGIFIHHPHVASGFFSGYTSFDDIMSDLEDRNALPDFTFLDLYRGYFEPGYGPKITDAYLHDLITNAKAQTNGRDVIYLGQDHTINNNYAPSKASIQRNLNTAVDAGADGIGWYIRSAYRKTEIGFDPFLPNTGDVDEDRFNTFTGSRDRFQYAYLSTMEATDEYDASDLFDLWISGDDFDFYENTLYLKNTDGEWEFIGDFYGYIDGDNPYSGGDRNRVAIFHALQRDQFIHDSGRTLEVKIENRTGSDGSRVDSIYAMPYFDTSHFQTERQATERVETTSSVKDVSLGHENVGSRLGADDSATAMLTLSDSEMSLNAFVHPEKRDKLQKLHELESTDGFDSDRRFDLWMYGEKLSQSDDELYLVTNDSEKDFIGTLETSNAKSGSTVVFRGLERDRFIGQDIREDYLDIEIRAGNCGKSATIKAIFAMPYFGSDHFVSEADASSLIEANQTYIQTYSLANQVWPAPAELQNPLQTRIQVPAVQYLPGTQEARWLEFLFTDDTGVLTDNPVYR